MNNEIISWIQERVRHRQYRLTLHAELERDHDQITLAEIEDALLSKLEIIEDYPFDQRGPSTLVLGFTMKAKPIHFVCGRGDYSMLVIITVYVPDENLWINNRKRKE
ncbi:MAG: DUF4258 domain-containing protein [Bacteroidota bacterium]|nr:DUF4258 domain-containing protein [Bacteroidota bacterium]